MRIQNGISMGREMQSAWPSAGNPISLALRSRSLSLYSQPYGVKTGGGTLSDNQIEFLVTPTNTAATTFRIYRNAVGDPLTNGLGSYTDVAASGSSQVVCLTTAPLFGNMYYRVRAFDASGRGSVYSDLYKFKSPCVLYDTFTGTDGTALESHAGESGVTWAKDPNFSGTALAIDTNDLKQNSGFGLYVSSVSPTAQPQDVILDYHIGSSTTGVEIYCDPCTTTASVTFYFVKVNAQTGAVNLEQYVGGSGTLLATGSATINVNTDYSLKVSIRQISATATNIKVFNNGTQIISYDHASPLAVGRVGFSMLGGSATGSRIKSIKAYNGPLRVYTTIGGESANVILPPNYDATASHPVIMANHGYGQSSAAWDTDGNIYATRENYLSAGYILCCSNAHGDNWGNQSAQDDAVALWAHMQSTYATNGQLVAFDISMGGLAGLNLLAAQTLPLLGLYGVYPVCSLASMYAVQSGTFKSSIRGNYGFVDDSGYAAGTAGYDPALKAASAYPSNVRARFVASPSDTLVIKTENSDAMITLLTGRLREVSLYTASGDHSNASHWPPAAEAAEQRTFFARCMV